MSAHTDLELRVARLEARQALADLVARYCMVLDAGDLEGVGRMFTSEAVLQTPGSSVSGRRDIVAFYADRMSRFEFTYHYPHSHVVSLLGDDSAEGIVCAHAEHAVEGRCVVAAIDYRDLYALEDAQWRFARRTLSMKYYLPLDEMTTGFHPGAMSGRPALDVGRSA
jgi:hypothetical protein